MLVQTNFGGVLTINGAPVGRELGKWGVEEYLNVKQVYINLSEQPIGWY